MTTERRLWEVVWVGQLVLFISCAVEWFYFPYAPFYRYIEVSELAPSATMMTLALRARSRVKIASLICWVIITLFAAYAGIASFPHWGNGVVDAPEAVKMRFERLSAISATMMFVAAGVLGVSGLSLLSLEVAAKFRADE